MSRADDAYGLGKLPHAFVAEEASDEQQMRLARLCSIKGDAFKRWQSTPESGRKPALPQPHWASLL
jgi:hypothetical protein